ncbi:MAG: D-2-hydroxyacid dehydrogenase [Prevotella sp.]|nr:D-2-hydroxyacid dehydrogenase [Prevotella sp.]
MRIVVLDGYAANPGDISWEGMQALGELTVYDRTAPAQLLERAQDADILLTNKVIINEAAMAQLPRLRYIGVLATGYNVVDVAAARQRGIVVTNIPAYSTDSVAQLTFAHILNITHSVDHYARQNRKGAWTASADFVYWDTPLIELSGKTMGIVGLGNIGMKVATIAHCFGMRVCAFTSKDAARLPEFIGKADLPELLSTSDVLSLHCPLTPQTQHLINVDSLAQMKPTAILVNTGRGPLVDEQAVADALKAKRLRAYCADVLSVEPAQADNPLLQCENAYLTPHIAWATYEARQRLMQIAIDNVKAFINGKPINVVNG